MTTAPLLTRTLEILREEAALLRTLVDLARDEQRALIASDYPAVESVAARMLETVRQLEARTAERVNLLRTAGEPLATLDELAAAAENLGVNGFTALRRQLLESADRLRQLQETNARLVLNAIRVRDRWAAILAGHLSPTYSPRGQASLQEGSGLVTRSA